MTGSIGELTIGRPVLMIGLWWSGRELGRSTLAGRAKRGHKAANEVSPGGPKQT